jgi:hypothetical protein
MPMDVLAVFEAAMRNKKISGRVLAVHLGTVANADYAVYIADFFIRISGISLVMVSLAVREKFIVIFRSDGLRIDIGRIAERQLSGYGTAGGHRTMARAELDLSRVVPEAGSGDAEPLQGWLFRRLAPDIKGLQALLPGPGRGRSSSRRLRVPGT